MKVILTADVKGSGKKGDVIEVSDGYARNCLIKKNLAVMATTTEVNAITNKKKAEEFHRQEEIKKWKQLAKDVEGKTVKCSVKAGENGKVFGSITSKEISDKLADLGFDIDKKKILLKEPIKTTGIYTVELKLLPDTNAKIKVFVSAE